jgi:hypothetical protein
MEGLDSPSAIISALWNHGGVMLQQAQARNIAWPELKTDEMTHVMAFFERSARSPK